MIENELSEVVIEVAKDVHFDLGPGLLAGAYKECLFHKLYQSGMSIEKDQPMPLVYDDLTLDMGYEIDLMVENRLVVLVLSVQEITDLHLAQIRTYLKLGNYKLGLLMNFNSVKMEDGIRRVDNV